MAFNFDGINQSLNRTTSASITNAPITLGAWLNTTTTSQEQYAFSLGVNGTRSNVALATWTNARWMIQWTRSDTGGGLFRTSANNTVVANQWTFVCGYLLNDSTSSNPNWIDVSGIYNSTNDVLQTFNENAPIFAAGSAGWTRMGVGALQRSTLGGYFGGRIAELGVWSTILTVAEMRSMAKGVKPIYIRPDSLEFYMPGIREMGQDLVKALTFTNNNSVTVVEHTRRHG